MAERLPDKLESNGRVEVRVAGTRIGTRRIIDFVSGGGNLDDGGLNDKVTIDTSGFGGAPTNLISTVTLMVSDPNGDAISVGDGAADYRVPSTVNGYNLISVAAAVTTVSSSGIPTVQIRNVTQAVDMLTTKLTIDAGETDSSTAATAAVIDTGNDDVATADLLRVDIDVAGTGAKGLMVELQFQAP